MKVVRPKPGLAPATALPLTEAERFVLSRIDGNLTVRDLVALTGMEQPQIETIVNKLATTGAVQVETADASSGYLPDTGSSNDVAASSRSGAEVARARHAAAQAADDSETATLADFAAALGMDPSAFAAAEPPAPIIEERVARHRVESKSSYPPPAMVDAPEAPSEPEPEEPAPALDLEPLGELIPVDDEGNPIPEDQLYDAELEAQAELEAGEVEEDAEATAVAEANYRQLYQTKFFSIPIDARIAAAKTASGAELMALCFDADPRVVGAILENPMQGLSHARMIAQYHRTGVGLEMLTRRMEYLKDMQTERRLLKNPQAGDVVIGRVMAPKRVFPTYKVAIDRDVPELTRVKARGFLRKKFQSAPPEDRADLVIRTEARCLILMTGCTFDARTTQILCGRPYNSVLFIQNLAKFSATPPGLLIHLFKQPFVRKNPLLKKLLLQHPNMPGEAKRL
ncbi:MAG: hypothetical protein JST00_29215 [Deltaproteobacteria bacterium]|nr:hypothetical protein [Deltaproteobacteria bacterium]